MAGSDSHLRQCLHKQSAAFCLFMEELHVGYWAKGAKEALPNVAKQGDFHDVRFLYQLDGCTRAVQIELRSTEI
jgi:hypothetical protein